MINELDSTPLKKKYPSRLDSPVGQFFYKINSAIDISNHLIRNDQTTISLTFLPSLLFLFVLISFEDFIIKFGCEVKKIINKNLHLNETEVENLDKISYKLNKGWDNNGLKLNFNAINKAYKESKLETEVFKTESLSKLQDLSTLRHVIAHQNGEFRREEHKRLQYYSIKPESIFKPSSKFIYETAIFINECAMNLQQTVLQKIFEKKKLSEWEESELDDVIISFGYFNLLLQEDEDDSKKIIINDNNLNIENSNQYNEDKAKAAKTSLLRKCRTYLQENYPE